MAVLNTTNYQGQTFNSGGLTPSPDNSTVGLQLYDGDLSRIVIETAKEEIPFTQLSPKTMMMRHRGKKYKREISLPIIDSRNFNSQGVDFLGLKTEPGVWYAYDANDVRTEYATEKLAWQSAGVVKVTEGSGNMYGSSRSFALQVGSYPIAGEVVGRANSIGYRRMIVECVPQRYAFSLPFTAESLEFDTETRLKIFMAKEVSKAYTKIKEAITRNTLMAVGMSNAYYCGGASQISEVDETCKLTLKDLRIFHEALNIALVPFDTNILTGSRNFATTPVERARYFYVPIELENTLRDLTHNGKEVFSPFSDYAGQVKTAKNEIGKIENSRFICVSDMPSWFGQGADATNGLDTDGDTIEDAGQDLRITDGRYDVFGLLFVGSDSFEVVGIQGMNDLSVRFNEPKGIAHYDDHADRGSMALSWYQSVLVYRRERVRMMFCSAE